MQAHQAHRDAMLAQAQGPRWWPFTTHRQAQARAAAARAVEAIDAASRQADAYERHVRQLTAQYEEAHHKAEDLRAEWEAEQAARARFEAEDKPRDYAEALLFAEFRRQDYRASLGPKGRRTAEAMRRFSRGLPARTDEERDWYQEWHVCYWEDVESALEAREADRRRSEEGTGQDEAPF